MSKMKRWMITMLLVSGLLLGQSGTTIARDQDAQLAEADRLNQQVIELYQAGRYAEAIPLAERALAIREKKLGPEHRDVAMTLYNLAALYYRQSDYGRVGPLYERALSIQEKTLGPEHPDVARTLEGLGELYLDQGDYPTAAPLLQRALAIREKKFGPEHAVVARTLNTLAVMYRIQGDYRQAMSLLKRAFEIQTNRLEPEHLDIARTANNLAMLYEDQGDYALAAPLYERALAIREKAVGPDHPLVATTLSNLAGLYHNQGDYERAATLLQRALAIREKAVGPDHPDVAVVLNNLGALYREQGEYERAAVWLQRALAIREKMLGSEHPRVIATLYNLAVLYYRQGDYRRAISFLQHGGELEERQLALILRTGSQRQKQLYLDRLSGETNTPVSMHARSIPQDTDAARLALTVILRRKGRELDASADQIATLRGRASREDLSLLDQLAATQSLLAALQFSGGGRLSPAAQQAEIARLEAEQGRLEDVISRRSAEFRAVAQPITLNAVRQAVPVDAALVELLVYQPFSIRAKTIEDRFGVARYVAYVLRRTDDAPQFIDLGEAATIDAEVERLRVALKDPKRTDAQTLARAVDERVMRPIRKLLGATRRVFVSPDGALNLIPFAALVDEDGKYLVENYSLSYLTSGRDLLRLQVQAESRSAPLVMADPLFDMAVTWPRSASQRVNQHSSQSNDNRRSMDFTQRDYKPLPGTAEEAAALAKLMPDAQMLTQGKATESAMKQIRSPRILHLATHGFFLADRQQESPADRTLRESFDTPPLSNASPLSAGWENPLLRSGLILAGVKQGQSGAGEDGVLTALETAGLDLWGTKLIVLSACETGLGDVRNGAGVYGLRRALVLAGSQTQVMSLWKVSDAGTRDLMTAYYTRLQQGEGRTEALRQVQLAMLQGRMLPAKSATSVKQNKLRETVETSEASAAEDYRHPYYWAAFIASGDWRSMGGK